MLMLRIWEIENFSNASRSNKKYHIISINRNDNYHNKILPTTFSGNKYNLQSYMRDNIYSDNFKPILLYVGNHSAPTEWTSCSISQLAGYRNTSVSAIYGSFEVSVRSLDRFELFLAESRRTLLTNGIIMINAAIIDLLEEDKLNNATYSGSGYTFGYVNNRLLDIGFCDIEYMDSFQISLNNDIFTHEVYDDSILIANDGITPLNIFARVCE